ncbi:unnamed protein product [Ectocarpus sp. 8 AP-2014]
MVRRRSWGGGLLPAGGRAWRVGALCCLYGLLLLGRSVEANDMNHKYHDRESVIVWVNTVGPWHNPQESYPYYRLPFCVPDLVEGTKQKRPSGLGELLAGNELRNSGMDVKFKVPLLKTALCTLLLDQTSAAQFRNAVEQEYMANIYIDDLPVWGHIGEKELGIYVNQRYTIQYNGNRIIRVLFEPDTAVAIAAETVLQFTYEVAWVETGVPFDKRFDSYLDPEFFKHRIHWFSIINSLMMVIFLCGLVALILVKTLKNDFAKYTPDDDDLEGPDAGIGEDSGWKQVHGDVFRAPKHLMLFSALFGTGCQLAVLVLLVILFAIAGPLHGDVYEERGEMVTTFIVCYALTSLVSGYMSGSYYRQFFTTPRAEQSSQWQRTMMLSVVMVPSVLFPVVFLLNLVAMHYNTVNTIPFMAVLKMALIWAFVSFPLCVAGSMFGRHWGGKGNFPCRVNSIPRPIPESLWYSQPNVVVPLAGILPFGSIFIEMYFILTSLWGSMYYYVYGFVLLVFAILVVVLVCTTIVAVYFVLNGENYHWQWVSFLSAASTAGYVFLYSGYYLWFKTHQSGFMQISFYFGYMGLFCAALGVMCGSIGVMGSTVFVKQIYRNIKVD